MARTRAVLQAPKTVTAAETQLNQDAIPVGSNRTGVVFCDLYAFTTPFVVVIQTSSDVSSQSGGTGNWITLGTMTFTGAGSQKLAITDLGDAIRWNVTSSGSGNTFALKVFFCDV